MMEERNLFGTLIEEERRRKNRRTLYVLAVGVVIVCYLLLQIIFGITRVTGNSMEPEIPDGSIIIFCRLSKSCEVDDIVVAQAEGQQVVKRIGAIDDGKIFLIGDNWAYSVDSRVFGTIESKDIMGKAICVIHLL